MIDIISDSRNVKKGDTFIAIKNVATDGHDFIEDAIKNGATKIICEHGEYPVETVIVEDTTKYLKEYLYNNYYPKIKDMKFIGVTGTNGKTTICFLTYQMLRKLGKKCAYIGTIGFYYDDVKKELNNTTPNTDLLYEMFLEAKEHGCEYIVMETSSHSLDYDRAYGIEFDETAFTNLTQDHLDYHKTMENYAKAKRILFTKTRGEKIAVINADDEYSKEFILDGNKNILISAKDGDVLIKDMDLSHDSTKITFEYEGKTYNVEINMIGRYNVYNYLTSVMLVNKLGFDLDTVLGLAKEISAPSGRMENIEYNGNSIFIDYAHTPDAVENVLKNAKEYTKGKIITIVGCGGDRDRTKRPIMGKISQDLSDYVIFTNDNPRTEDEKQIMDDILAGVSGDNYEVIYDRKEAIEKAIDMLDKNDVLMILGKGHEDYQVIGKEKVHFSDKETVEKYIQEK